jgi:pyrroline-5-carboxylate reductase
VAWIEDEDLMDPVTAVSGSGPAYLFLVAEELAAAGIAAGLPPNLAERLARLTITGAGALLASSPLSPNQLRENVTSPGGSTEAALMILRGPRGLSDLMTTAVRAAAERSRALSRQLP